MEAQQPRRGCTESRHKLLQFPLILKGKVWAIVSSQPDNNPPTLSMSKKLQQSDRLPQFKLKLVDGDELSLPRGMSSRYIALLFFRGTW